MGRFFVYKTAPRLFKINKPLTSLVSVLKDCLNIFWEGHKNEISKLFLMLLSNSKQILEILTNFSGLLRIYELYSHGKKLNWLFLKTPKVWWPNAQLHAMFINHKSLFTELLPNHFELVAALVLLYWGPLQIETTVDKSRT